MAAPRTSKTKKPASRRASSKTVEPEVSTSRERVDSSHGHSLGRFLVTTDGRTDSAELVVIDAYWLRVSWQLSAATLARAEKALGRAWHQARPMLRLVGLTTGESSAFEVSSAVDLPVPGDAREWFARCPEESHVEAHIGYLSDDDSRFFKLANSETVATRSVSSPTIAPDGGLPDDVLAELQRVRTGAAPFSLAVDGELVLRGQTAPSAEVGVGDQTITADAEGRFEIRRPLENGRTVLPIEARSATGHESRSGVASADFNLRVLGQTDDTE